LSEFDLLIAVECFCCHRNLLKHYYNSYLGDVNLNMLILDRQVANLLVQAEAAYSVLRLS